MAPNRDGGGGQPLPPQQLPNTGKDVTFHKDKLLDIAKALQKDLDELNKHGTKGSLFDFQSVADADPKGFVSQEALGNYPAAQGVHMTCKTAYETVGNVYGAFTDAYQGLINTLTQNAKNYHGTEHQNEQN